MKKLNVYYAKVENMGDKLNKEIIEKCFGYDVCRRTYLTGQLSGIGSGLGNCTLEGNFFKKTLKKIFGLLFPSVSIWGTGFISYKNCDEKFYKKKINFCAVRGELSKKRVEKLLGRELDIPVGDAGILSSYLLDNRPKLKYDVGIIAHYKEQDDEVFKKLLLRFNNSVFIDVKDTPLNVTHKIAECKVIISSSLHGLIIADSLGVPNKHIVVTDNLLGDGFKFDDYYSAYGLKHEYVDMNKDDIYNLEDVVNDYKITKEMVEEKKQDMLNCFPYSKVN